MSPVLATLDDTRPSPPWRRLQGFTPEQVSTRNLWLATLASLRIEEEGVHLPLRACIETGPSGPTWLQFRTRSGQAALYPDLVEGRPVFWPERARGPQLAEAIKLVEVFEPLLLTLEQAIGLAFDPCGFGYPPGGPQISLTLGDTDGKRQHRLWLAAEPALIAAFPPVLRPILPAGLHLRAPLAIAACSAPRGELHLLEPGDVVLLDSPNETGWLAGVGAGRARLNGRFHPRGSTFTLFLQETSPVSDIDAIAIPFTVPVEMDTWAPSDLPVQISILIADLEIPVAQLAALMPGGILQLPGVATEPEVQVLANGRRLASGRLVAIGETYGVLVDRLAD